MLLVMVIVPLYLPSSTTLVSQEGVSGAKDQLENALTRWSNHLGTAKWYCSRTDSWFPNSKYTIAETDGGWLQNLQWQNIFWRQTKGRRGYRSQMYEEKVLPLLDDAIAVASKDGVASEADMAKSFCQAWAWSTSYGCLRWVYQEG